jgi:hypothetical protein
MIELFKMLREENIDAPDGGGGGGDPWYSSLSEDVRGAEGFEDFASKYGSLDEAVKGGFNASKQVGRATEGMIKLPGENATDEERQAFQREALGVPETPEGYEWQAPEGVDLDALGIEADSLKEASAKLHEAGLSPSQYKAAMDLYANTRAQEQEMFSAHQAKLATETEAALKKEWGADYNDNIKLANDTAEKLGIAEMLKGYGIINEKPVIDLLHKFGQATAEDGLDGSGGKVSKSDQLAQLKASPAYRDKTHPDHYKTVEQAANLLGPRPSDY